jgi:hypothetical protein
MNKRSVKARPAKAGRSPAVRKAVSRQSAGKPQPSSMAAVAALTAAVNANVRRTVPVAEVTARAPVLRTHKFRVGQTVLYTSSPISRPGASGSYKVVKLLPSDGDDYQYRIKNSDEAFERVAKESQLDTDR